MSSLPLALGDSLEEFWPFRRAAAVFAGLVALSLIISSSSIAALFQLAWNSEQYSHVLIILPASLCLLAFEKKPVLAAQASWKAGGSLLLCAAAIALWGLNLEGNDRLTVMILALVTFWIGSFILCFGIRAFRTLRFPLLFLFWMVPPPAFVMEKITYVLQNGSTDVTYWMFRCFAIPVERSGFVLSLPNVNIEVARECSGIRSSITLLVTSLALSCLYLKSRWRQALVIACVLALAILKNGLRIFIISTLAVYQDPSWLEGRLHHNGGVLFFALALFAVTALIAWLHHSEREVKKAEPVRRSFVEV